MFELTVGEVLVLIARVVPALQAKGVLDARGTIVTATASTEDQIVSIVAELEAELVRDGVVVPEKLDRVIKALPSILLMVGV